VEKVRGEAQSSGKKTGEVYNPNLALSRRITLSFYVWCATVWKANDYLALCDSDKFTKQ
jgi:hypothetical protein